MQTYKPKKGMSEGWDRNLGMDSAYMGIRVAGRSDSGTSFALTAATGDGSALEQSKYGIDENTGYVPIRDQFQCGISSNTGSVQMRDQFQYGVGSNAVQSCMRGGGGASARDEIKIWEWIRHR